MQFAKSRADVIRSVPQRWLLNYWHRLCGQKPLPLWKDLTGSELSRMTDNLLFCDVMREGDGERFLIRYKGARIIEAYGECDGRYLDDTLPPLARETALSTYRHAIATRRPIYTVVKAQDRAGKPVDFERLLLPFSHQGESVDSILAALEWVSIEGGFEGRELLRSQAAAPAYSVCATIEQIESDIIP